jgi:3-isopropylmalate/(R)-2-methylmalate dehydratase small subunit
MIIEGKIWKFGDDISTDLIMPGTEVLAQPDLPEEEAARNYCMQANRPGWAPTVKQGDILVAGHNFGCGSSRPAARLIKALGIGIILAHSMSRLFFRNAVNIGLPVLICHGVSGLFEEGETARVDLESGEVCNPAKGIRIQGEALPAGSPPAEILRAGGLKSFMQTELTRDVG